MVAFERRIAKLDSDAKFRNCASALNIRSVGDFWQWAYSDLLQNTTRGVLAEYIIAVLLCADHSPRNPWLPYDLKLKDGTTIEVKTMSRIQAWAQKQLSPPKVVINEKRSWDPETGITEQDPTLNADIYVIAYFTSEDHLIADPLNLDQWTFFVLNKNEVNATLKKSKSISLKTLNKLSKKPLRPYELQSEIAKSKKQLLSQSTL